MTMIERRMLLDGGMGASAATPSLVPPSPKPEPLDNQDDTMAEPLAGLAASRRRTQPTNRIVNPEVPVAPTTPRPKSDWGQPQFIGGVSSLRAKILGREPKPQAETPQATPRAYSMMQPTMERSEYADRLKNIPSYLTDKGYPRLSGVASFLEGQGSIDPTAPFRGKRSGKGAAWAMLAATTGLSTATSLMDLEYQDQIINDLSLREYGYPEEVMREAAQAVSGASAVASVPGVMLDSAIMDAQIVGASAAAGALAGSAFLGVGALPGAGIGAAWGRIIAGASSFIDYSIEPLINAFMGNKMGTSDWIGIPTAYDIVPYDPTKEDAPYSAAVQFGNAGGNIGLNTYFGTKQAGKFLSPEAASIEWDRHTSNYYAMNPQVKDPKMPEVTELISQGYFIGKNDNGEWGIDHNAYEDYRYTTVALLDPEASRKFLPPLSEEGKEWKRLYGNNLNESIWTSLWMNEFVR